MAVMDNFHIDVTGRNDEPLGNALAIAFALNGQEAVSFSFVDRLVEARRGAFTRRGLALRWGGAHPTDLNVHGLPFRLKPKDALTFVSLWLSQTEMGPEPDHDGSNVPGWRVYLPQAGEHLDRYVICVVEPAWAELGK